LERRHRVARQLANRLAGLRVAPRPFLDLRIVEQVRDQKAEPLALLNNHPVVARHLRPSPCATPCSSISANIRIDVSGVLSSCDTVDPPRRGTRYRRPARAMP